MKTIIRLFIVPLVAICGSLLVQGQDTQPPPTPPPQALPAPRPPEPVQWDKNDVTPRTQQRLRSTTALPPSAGGGGGTRYGATSGGYGGGYGTTGSGAFSERLQRIITRASGPVPGPSQLIIRSSAMDPKEQTALGEDLAVMSHILNKALDESSGNRPPTAMGIDVFGAQGHSGARTLYLEDYGVLYTLNVSIPLLAAKPALEKKKEAAPADTAWEEAKRELYGQGTRPAAVGAPIEEFSAEKVEKLTDALVEALRNAKNIRGLKPDDSITLCVLGTAAGPENHGGESAAGSPPPPPSVTAVYPDAGPQKGTVMTLRVKKSDADAFAKGTLKPDKFRKQVRVERYEGGLAEGGGAGGGWMGGGVIGTGGKM